MYLASLPSFLHCSTHCQYLELEMMIVPQGPQLLHEVVWVASRPVAEEAVREMLVLDLVRVFARARSDQVTDHVNKSVHELSVRHVCRVVGGPSKPLVEECFDLTGEKTK